VVSILKPGKDPMLPLSYRPLSLPDTDGKLFENILHTRVLQEVNKCGLLCDEQFDFQPRHSMTLQLARLAERVAKAFDTVWVKGFLYKLTILNFLSYLVQIISSLLDCRTFQTSFQSATSTCSGMRAVVAQRGLVSTVLFGLYVNDIPTPSRHV
jgi:hypothetical protein